jgi:sortase A
MQVLRVLAWVSGLAGCALLLYTGFRVWDPFAAQRQHALMGDLYHQWGQPSQVSQPSRCSGSVPQVRPATGKPFALIRIPRFGPNWKFTIVEGATLAQLSGGPGHVTGTQFPGQPGNFAVAAHDITAGNAFLHLGDLRPGNIITVVTKCHVYRYAVQSKHVVRYTDVAVLDPVPGQPGKRPRKQLITLITCTPVTLAFTPYRIIVTGHLVSVTQRVSAGRGVAGAAARDRPDLTGGRLP